jgi:hypothetical protein
MHLRVLIVPIKGQICTSCFLVDNKKNNPSLLKIIWLFAVLCGKHVRTTDHKNMLSFEPGSGSTLRGKCESISPPGEGLVSRPFVYLTCQRGDTTSQAWQTVRRTGLKDMFPNLKYSKSEILKDTYAILD